MEKGTADMYEMYTYGRTNLAMVNLMIQSPYITKIKRDAAMTFTSYIANTGGLLGLCVGFSFISGIEILFWCCLCCKSKNNVGGLMTQVTDDVVIVNNKV